MQLEQNHAEIAWSNNLMQFDKARVMRAFFMAIHKPYTDIQTATKALFEERWIDDATGAQLDGIGQILRQPRFVDFPLEIHYFGFDGQRNIGGFAQFKLKQNTSKTTQENIAALDDAMYRKVLYWRIAVLTGSGTAPDIHRALHYILDIHQIRMIALGNANVGIWLALNTTANYALLHNLAHWLPVAAGVGYELSVSTGKHTFGFKRQNLSGFGIGTLTRRFT